MAVNILNSGDPIPSVKEADSSGLVAMGGSLTREMLLSAYSRGIFPWYSQNEPLMWWSPDPRMVLFPGEIHISKSMNKLLAKNKFKVTVNRCFEKIINMCRNVDNRGTETWITDEMVKAYIDLYNCGYAHSVEIWSFDNLAGGFYGVAMGNIFFGESMFSLLENASKYGLIRFSRYLSSIKFKLIDCQVYTPHLASMGARLIPGKEFESLLSRYVGKIGNNKTVFNAII